MKHLFIRPILVFLCAITFSCGNDKQNNPEPAQLPRQCRIIETSSTGSYVSKAVYSYDSTNILKCINSRSNNRPIIVTYEYNNLKQPTRESFKDTLGNEFIYITYKYNKEGKLSERESFSKQGNSFVSNTYYTYQYDANGELIRQNNIYSNSTYVTFTYSNLKKVIDYYSGAGVFLGSDEAEYDNRQIPPYQDGVNHPSFDRFDRNPILKFTTNRVSSELPYTCSYQYNAEGYPVQMIRTFQGNNPEIWTYNYDCQ